MRYLTGFILLIAAGVGCSRGAERPVAATPTSPTAAVTADGAITDDRQLHYAAVG